MVRASGSILVLVLAACTGAGSTPATTSGTRADAPVTVQETTSTLASPPNVAPRFPPGRLAQGPHRTSTFAYPLTMTLPPGSWATNGETDTVIHILQAGVPDFGEAFVYDWPGVVLIAFPSLDDQAVAAHLDGLDELSATSSEPIEIDGRPAVRVDAQSAGNPEFQLPGSDAPFAGLGGFWFSDPEVEAVRYRIFLIDMSAGALLAWYSAPADRFDDLVGDATAAIESIVFD